MDTETPNAVPPLETDEKMDTGQALKEVGKIANSTSDVILKYVMVGVFCLFGFLIFFQWKQNAASPDKVIDIMERQVGALTSSLKIQETSLAEIQKFAIVVPMEHRDLATKQTMTDEKVSRLGSEQAELRAAIKANSDAVKENTEAVARLIGVIEVKIGPDPNAQRPPKN